MAHWTWVGKRSLKVQVGSKVLRIAGWRRWMSLLVVDILEPRPGFYHILRAPQLQR
jgi:hypothetical protein